LRLVFLFPEFPQHLVKALVHLEPVELQGQFFSGAPEPDSALDLIAAFPRKRLASLDFLSILPF
jgi:hypothetical protein